MRRRHHVTVLRSAVKLWYCLFCSNFWASFLSELLNPQKVSRDMRSGITIFPSTWWSLAVGLNPSTVTTSSPFQAVCNIYSSSSLDFHSIQPSFSSLPSSCVSQVLGCAQYQSPMAWGLWRDTEMWVVTYKNTGQHHRCFSICRPWKWLFFLSTTAMILQCYHTHKYNSQAEAEYLKTLLLWVLTTPVKSNPEIYN